MHVASTRALGILNSRVAGVWLEISRPGMARMAMKCYEDHGTFGTRSAGLVRCTLWAFHKTAGSEPNEPTESTSLFHPGGKFPEGPWRQNFANLRSGTEQRMRYHGIPALATRCYQGCYQLPRHRFLWLSEHLRASERDWLRCGCFS